MISVYEPVLTIPLKAMVLYIFFAMVLGATAGAIAGAVVWWSARHPQPPDTPESPLPSGKTRRRSGPVYTGTIHPPATASPVQLRPLRAVPEDLIVTQWLPVVVPSQDDIDTVDLTEERQAVAAAQTRFDIERQL